MAGISLNDAARMSRGRNGQKLSEVSLRAAAARGALKAHKDGKAWKTTEADLKKYLSERPYWWKPGKQSKR